MRNFILCFISLGIGCFIIKDLGFSVEDFNTFAKDPKYTYILTGFTELVKAVILSLFLITLWLVNIAVYLGGIFEEKPHVLGQSSEGTVS